MTDEVQHQGASRLRLKRLQSPITAMAAGAVFFLSALLAQAQEKMPKSPVYTVLYTFTGGTDGAAPEAGLTRDLEGNLYGTTALGGDPNCAVFEPSCGVVFKVDRHGKETVLHTFTGPPDGSDPSFSGVVRDEEGDLYGTTYAGGDSSSPGGTVFELDRVGKEIVLHNFASPVDGHNPNAGVIRDEEGNLYGTTAAAGAYNRGTVFKLDRAGNEVVLYSFSAGIDGGVPEAGLIRDEEGNLYGTTLAGGDLSGCSGAGCGVVFKLDCAGSETVLYSFTGGADGARPSASLIRDEKGSLYGTTSGGGEGFSSPVCAPFGCGVVFKLDRAGKETVLYAFTGGTDGANPNAPLFRRGGNFYGTTLYGGNQDLFCSGYCGVVFQVDKAGKETVLYAFTGTTDGENPNAGLIGDEEGNLYGTTGYGGDLDNTQAPCYGDGCGVVFKLKLPEECNDDSAAESSTPLSRESEAPTPQNPTTAIPANGLPRGHRSRFQPQPLYPMPDSGKGLNN